MVKKKIIIAMSILIILVIVFILWNNRTVSTITLDINPSIQINLDKHNKVKKVIAINNDAKGIIDKNMNGKDMMTAINMITDNVSESGIIKDNEVIILLSSTGNIDNSKLEHEIKANLTEKNIINQVIIIENVTKEDMRLAKKENITPAKAAYINMILKEHQNIDEEVLLDKSVKELVKTKNNGKYCLNGYIQEGDFCLKEINRLEAKSGEVCPNGYYGYDKKCYEEVGSILSDELTCRDNEHFKLVNGKCVGVEEREANGKFSCQVGELIKRGEVKYQKVRDVGEYDEYLCEDKSEAKYPTERCYQQEHAIINGKCGMGPKPLLPTPSGCADDDINYNGGCYDLTPDEPYICPDGERFDTNTEICPDTIKYTKASGIYSCDSGYTLNGSKCTKEITEEARNKPMCREGYTLVDDGRCINKNKTTDYVIGNICDMPDSRVDGNQCIIYEIIDAIE